MCVRICDIYYIYYTGSSCNCIYYAASSRVYCIGCSGILYILYWKQPGLRSGGAGSQDSIYIYIYIYLYKMLANTIYHVASTNCCIILNPQFARWYIMYKYACIYIYIHLHKYTFMYTDTVVIFINVYIYIHMHIYTYIIMNLCIYISTHTHIHTYIIHTHTHT